MDGDDRNGKDKRANGAAMGDEEFEKLLDEMDELGRQADALREKVNHLIDEMRENDVVADEDEGVSEGADGDTPGEVDGREDEEGNACSQPEDPAEDTEAPL